MSYRGVGSIDPSGALSDPTINALLACGFCPTQYPAVDLDHSSWATASGDNTDPSSFLSLYNAGLECSGPPVFTSLSQCPSAAPSQPSTICPSGWSGTFPACVPPTTLPAGTVYTTPITNPTPVQIQQAPPSDLAPLNPMQTGGVINSSGAYQSVSPVSSGNWFTESMLFGLPNWLLALAAGGAVYLAVNRG